MVIPRSLSTDSLVIGSMRYGEADRILTLYTRERGRLSAIVKGVRRPRSKFGGRLEPFSLVRVELYAGRSLYTVTGAETVRSFQGVRDSLFRLAEGGRLVEVVKRLFPEEEGNPYAFNLLVRSLDQLARTPGPEAAALVVLATRLKLLLALGYLPELDHCQRCGAADYLCGFNPVLGGVLCTECFGEGAEDCFSLSPRGLGAMRELLERPVSEASLVELDDPASAEVERTLLRILAHHGH